MQARKHTALDFDDLVRMRVVMKRAKHFITCKGKFIGSKSEYNIKNLLCAAEQSLNAVQLSMFGMDGTSISALTGEL